MNTWWCAIDKKYSSYNELKYRKVIAQGWPQLGDLQLLFPFIPKHKRDFEKVIKMLAVIIYKDLKPGELKKRALKGGAPALWNLLNLKKGDLIVGIEGTLVKGFCKLEKDALRSYKYDPKYRDMLKLSVFLPSG